MLFVLLSSHRDLLQVICDFAIHTTNPAVLEPWKKRNWLLYRCSVACCSEEHLSLHRDSVKCFPYRSLPRLVWCGVGCISQKSYSSLNWQFWVFLCKKKKKKRKYLDVNPGCARQRGKETTWWLHVISKQARWSLCFAPLSKTLKYTKCGTGQKDNGLASPL